MFEARFEAGPLGLSLTQENTVVSVSPGGQADTLGVKVGDLIVSVGSSSAIGVSHDALLGLIKAQTRPMVLLFERKSGEEQLQQQPVDTAASTPSLSKIAGSPLLRAPSFLSSGQNMMKSVLGVGAQAVRAIDSTINRAIDDSAKQAKVCTARIVHIHPLFLSFSCSSSRIDCINRMIEYILTHTIDFHTSPFSLNRTWLELLPAQAGLESS